MLDIKQSHVHDDPAFLVTFTAASLDSYGSNELPDLVIFQLINMVTVQVLLKMVL
jgi:hypothetical protein